MPDRPLKIIMTVDPEIPVPPSGYGGIERIAHMLVCGFAKRGHEVHLFAHPDSKTEAKLIPFAGKKSGSIADTARNALQIKKYIKKIGNPDIVHSFGRLAYLLPLLGSPVPKVQSYQRRITPRSVKLGILLAKDTIVFAACSKFCAETADFIGGRWAVIPNGVPINKYRFAAEVPEDAPLVFLGRIEGIKGVHIAIEVAKRSGRKLVIAGNHAKHGNEHEYYKRVILPQCDGETIRYVGEIDDAKKNELLGSASCLLFPIEWDEPFGIVMAEALACGTPVIAFRRGSVPEVVESGLNGFICDTKEEMVESVKKINLIERKKCREIAEGKFSDKVIVEAYLSLYRSFYVSLRS